MSFVLYVVRGTRIFLTIKAIFTSTGLEKSTGDEDEGIVLYAASFYAEQGGQLTFDIQDSY